jgi:hypothetical protein
VAVELRAVSVPVGFPSPLSVLLVGEQHDPDRPAGRSRESRDRARRFADDPDARGVVDRPRSQVPRIEMRAEQDDLVGPLRPADLPDDVRAGHVRLGAASEGETHRDRPRAGQPLEQVRVGRGERGGGERRPVVELHHPGVGQPGARRADAPDQDGRRPELPRLDRSPEPDRDRLSVARSVARPLHPLGEEHDPAADGLRRKRRQALDVLRRDDGRLDSRLGRRAAPSEGRHDELLPDGGDDFRRFRAALPSRLHEGFLVDVRETEARELRDRPAARRGGALRAGKTRADAVGQRHRDVGGAATAREGIPEVRGGLRDRVRRGRQGGRCEEHPGGGENAHRRKPPSSIVSAVPFFP